MTLLTPQTKVRLTYFFYAVAIVGAVVGLTIGILTLSRVDTASARIEAQQSILQDQVAGQKEVLKGVQTLLANQGKTTEEINKSLSCIMVFFGIPNSAEYFISNFSTCEITSTRTGQTEVLPLPSVQNTNENKVVTQSTQPSQQPQEQPEQADPSTTPPPAQITPVSAVERLGYILNDTLGEIPKALRNVLETITPF